MIIFEIQLESRADEIWRRSIGGTDVGATAEGTTPDLPLALAILSVRLNADAPTAADWILFAMDR